MASDNARLPPQSRRHDPVLGGMRKRKGEEATQVCAWHGYYEFRCGKPVSKANRSAPFQYSVTKNCPSDDVLPMNSSASEVQSPPHGCGLALFFDPHNYLDAQCPDLIPNRVTRTMPF